MNNTEKTYNEITNLLKKIPLSERLKILSNLIFNDYQEYKKFDTLYKNIDKQDLKLLDNFRELEELYHFNKDSYVFVLLNAAHDLLSVSSSIESDLKSK